MSGRRLLFLNFSRILVTFGVPNRMCLRWRSRGIALALSECLTYLHWGTYPAKRYASHLRWALGLPPLIFNSAARVEKGRTMQARMMRYAARYRDHRNLVCFPLAATLGVLLAMVASPATAQVGPPETRGHVYLPETHGATVMSTIINAQANYVAALGDYAESVAIARRHHAAAEEHEMRNAVQWVNTYFEMRALNRAYRLKENPYLDKEANREAQRERRMYEFPDLVTQGDVTDELNWLLDKLTSMSIAYQHVSGNDDELIGGRLDMPLSPHDVRHILFTDGGTRNGHKLVFRALDPQVLETEWPLALRGPEFATARLNFANVRELALEEKRQTGEISPDTHALLREAVDRLALQFQMVYDRQRRLASPLEYASVVLPGRRYVVSLAHQVFRAVTTNETRAFDGSYRFEGKSALALVQHMSRNGLQFASPAEGDEPTYKRLVESLRHVWMYFDQDES